MPRSRALVSRTLRQAARLAVLRAVLASELSRDVPCVGCGAQPGRTRRGLPTIVLHHPDYSRPLWVFPLCRECHGAVHMGRPVPGVPPSVPFWQEQPERVLRCAVETGRRPRGMPPAAFEAALAAHGLTEAFRRTRTPANLAARRPGGDRAGDLPFCHVPRSA